MNKIIIAGIEIPFEKLEALGWTPPESNEIEILSGCPVLVWDEDEFYNDKDNKLAANYSAYHKDESRPHRIIGSNCYKYCEIDYTRKGCVIPWNGGECPVDLDAKVTYIMRCGDAAFEEPSGDLRWSHMNLDSDIIAYIVWPDWLTIEDKG